MARDKVIIDTEQVINPTHLPAVRTGRKLTCSSLRRFVCDCSPGVDDVLAILLALASVITISYTSHPLLIY